MLFSLDVIRAHKGDCLILHYGPDDNPRLIMIDGGPAAVYEPHLKPRLKDIRAARGIAANRPLLVDMLMVSHVDDDHIRGILDMTRDLITSEMNGKAPFVRILNAWHNSFENIIDDTPNELTAAFRSHFGAASMNGDPPEDLMIDSDDEINSEVLSSSMKVLASIEQGARLRSDLDRLNVPLNTEFDGKLIMAEEDGDVLDMGDGLQLTVIGPMISELKKLHGKHQAWLRELEEKGLSPADALAAYVDRSVPNLSSIVVLAEVDGTSMLLTGDARGDKILQGMEFVGLILPDGTIHVDLLKVPHHGSANNLDDDFFERITADHYVFSGDGKHGNPDRTALEMLLNARGNADYTIYITYPIKEIDAERKKDWEKEQAKEERRREKNPNAKVRPNWSKKKHSLAALLEDHEEFAEKVTVVGDQGVHTIDLIDPIA